ncbi:polyhomeotic-like protein 2 isoform X2 [Xyrauchen texanus]|uniref:polyhomeotic-like protein 2 isoform X2 n=1 Tax=Xyrauchen texanus TaxID=154827 RepID=UPI002242BF1C|nr:polyhomeotic-like protein 2 isoform X2 [Xyrauchen texanus]
MQRRREEQTKRGSVTNCWRGLDSPFQAGWECEGSTLALDQAQAVGGHPMEKEQDSVAFSASVTIPSTTSASTGSNTISSCSNRQQAVPQISVYGGITDRQTVQVMQQALNRQPSSAAAQYLQQMYAAQQQHLMLQTAALQQQHLSLAAVQQASIVAGRQRCNQNGTTSQQTVASQTTINLATSPAAAHLISRAHSGGSVPVCIAQQAVLLGNSSTPTLTASQAQMYLRAQMAQQSNLVQVARSLGRAVPLSPQLIFTPAATVTAVQADTSALSINTMPTSGQVQNLALRSQQGVLASSLSHTQLQSLSVKQSTGASAQLAVNSQPVARLKCHGAEPNPQGVVAKGNPAETSSETVRMNDKTSELTTQELNMCPSVTSVVGNPLISTAYTQIQTHQLLQQHKQQFLIQQQPQIMQRSQAKLLEAATIQPSLQSHTVNAVAIHPALAPQPQHSLIPVLPNVPVTCQQATIFHSTSVSHQAITQNGQPPILSHNNAAPLELTAVNLQIQPVPTQIGVVKQDGSDKDSAIPLEVRELCSLQTQQQLLSIPTQVPTRTEPCQLVKQSDQSQVTENIEGRVNVKAGVSSPPAMTSGSGNNAPTVTGSAPQNGESKPPPQAIVKPQILTHVIEGFVIQEGAEPFPVERPSLLIENLKKQKQPLSQTSHNADSEMEDLSQQELKNLDEEPRLSCEFCGIIDFAYNFRRSKRFCSTVCAKRYNVGCTKRMGLFPRKSTLDNSKKQRATDIKKRNPSAQTANGASMLSPHPLHPSHGESSQCSDMSSYEEPLSPLSATSSGAQRLPNEHRSDHSREISLLTQQFLVTDPARWNVEDVYEFICSLPGCQEIAEEFRSQEIDGQALLLLKEDHLMSTMNIKLGPALKIFARISMLKDS